LTITDLPTSKNILDVQ
jgi:hypothetical protein